MAREWSTIAIADLYPVLVGVQVDVMNSAALKYSNAIPPVLAQTAPFDAVMPYVIDGVRNAIQQGSQWCSTLSQSVPPEIKLDVIYLVLEAMQARLPSLKFTDSQTAAIKRAHGMVERLRKREQLVTAPPAYIAPDIQSVSLFTVTETITRQFAPGGEDSAGSMAGIV